MGLFRTVVIVVLVAVAAYLARLWLNGPMCDSDARLNGKVVIVTGANTGIGLETAADLAHRGATVYLACRSTEKGLRAAEHISERTGVPAQRLPVMHLDLSRIKSVKKFAFEFKRREDRLDILINNAGIGLYPNHTITEDGLELTMATNHFGHFLLTNLLLDMLKASAPSRVVTVSAKINLVFRSVLDPRDLTLRSDNYDSGLAYAFSKTANILFSAELGRRLEGTGVTTYSLHPGVVISDFARHITGVKRALYLLAYTPFVKDAVHGAQTSICCAINDNLAQETGKYYEDCAETDPPYDADSAEKARELWEASERMVKLPKDSGTQM